MKKIISLVAASLLAASIGNAKEIKIGVVMPMSGPLGGYGQGSYRGIELAHELQSTLKNGDTIKLILVDNKSDKIEAANGMQKLVSKDKVSAVIGALTSTNTMAITKIAGRNQTPLVAPVATSPRMTKNRKYANRVCFSDAFQGSVAANFVKNDLGKTKVVVITDVKQDYSIGISKVFKKEFKKLGGKILKQVKINSGDTDFKAMISSIKAMKPQLVYLPIYSAEAALIAKQSAQAGLNVAFVGSDGMAADKVFFEAGGKAVEGFYSTGLSSPDAPKTTEASQVFAKAHAKKYTQSVHDFAPLSADAYNVIINAMNECKNPDDGACVNSKIKSTSNFAGVSGLLSIGANGDATRSAIINQIKNGKSVYIKTVNP